MKKYCIGVDVGGTSIKLGLFENTGTVIRKWDIPTNTAENGKLILPDIARTIKNKMDELKLLPSDIKGIGIGTPGLISADGYVSGAVNLGWKHVLVSKEITKLTGIASKAGNDANVAALGEMWQGSAKGYKNIVMVTIGTGIGGGVIINEKIVPGFFGAAGEIGHMPVVYDEKEYCKCGRKGCLEQAASATGIVRNAGRLLADPARSSLLRNEEKVTAKAVFDAAEAGDELAMEAVERAGKFLGIALASVTSVIDPEIYIIGGGVSQAGGFLIDMIEKNYRENVLSNSRDTKIKLAALGNDAGIYGAARMVL